LNSRGSKKNDVKQYYMNECRTQSTGLLPYN